MSRPMWELAAELIGGGGRRPLPRRVGTITHPAVPMEATLFERPTECARSGSL